MMNQEKKRSLLFEIGVEEVPSSYFDAAKASLLSAARTLLLECGHAADDLKVETTPRRFVIHASHLSRIPPQAEEKLGPLKEQAFENDKPTPAMLGFLKNTGGRMEDVSFKETPRGIRVCIKTTKAFKPLRHFFESLPKAIQFPRLMRWDDSGYLFTRPVRWTFAFVARKRERYAVGKVQSSAFTYGHRFLSAGKIKVRSADFEAFKHLLRRHHVILSFDERVKQIKARLKKYRGQDEELINTVAHLVEEPFAIRGSFSRDYLKLPSSVLATAMLKHQRIFPQFDGSGKLENRFVAFVNGRRRGNVKRIIKNYESVLRSRLEDARFFFEEDQKEKLEAKVGKLKEMVFLGSLGSYYDKTKRLEALSVFLGKEMSLAPTVIDRAKRAALLSKADLITRLVYEFPELQGAVGSEYARIQGEDPEVARALAGQYVPVNLAQDFRPLKKWVNIEGAILGICDRMDLLVGASGLGIEANSSADPYALRRAAGGIVKMLRAHRLPFSLSNLILKSREQFGNLIKISEADLVRKLTPFFKERIAFELQLKSGTDPYELLHGIFSSGWDSVSEVYDKFETLTAELQHQSFLRACKVMERTGNILRGIKEKVEADVSPDLFESPLERQLFALAEREAPEIEKLAAQKNYGRAARRYGECFYQPVHDFFDQVMVNVEDEKIRRNRQALVKKVNQICASRIADLSRVAKSECI